MASRQVIDYFIKISFHIHIWFLFFRVLGKGDDVVSTYTATYTKATVSTYVASMVADSDNIPDYLEKRFGLDPFNPSLTVNLYEGTRSNNCLHIVKPLDNDKTM